MIQKIKRIVTTGLIAAMAFVPALSVAGVASAADPSIQNNVKQGTCLSTDASKCPTGGSAEASVNELIADVINIFSLVVGVVAVIMIIVGGFQYITSGGDSTKVGNAKNTILYAIIGLVIVALSQFIVRFVLEKVTA